MPEPAAGAAYVPLSRLVEDQVLEVRAAVAELTLDLGAVHDTRVALRRLRATLTVFGPVLEDVPAGLVPDLRWFARQVGATRDAEVVAGRLGPALLADTPDAAALRGHLDQWAVESSESARNAMGQARTGQLLEGLGRLHLNLPDAPQIYLDIRTQRLVVRALEDLCDDLPLALTGARSEHSTGKRARLLHTQRKRVKTVRAVTAVLDTAPGARSKLNKALRDVQELLGDHHDTVITRAWLRRVAQRDPEAAGLASDLRRDERRAQAAIEELLPRAVGRLVRRVASVRRTPAVHLSSP